MRKNMHPETRQVVRQQLKTLAKDLQISKRDLRDHMSSGAYKVEEQWHIARARREYRHIHVAYCLARGRTVKQVENHFRVENPLDKKLLAEYAATFAQLDVENNEKFPRKPRVELEQ